MRSVRLLQVALVSLLAGSLFFILHSSLRPSPGALAIAAATAATPHVLGACDLVAKSQIEAILGEPLAPPHVRAGLCEYRRAGRDAGARGDLPVVGVRLYRSITQPTFEAQAARSADLFALTPEPVPALGDEALRSGTSALSVYAHGAAFTITHDPSVDDAKTLALATEALAALPARP